MDDALTQFAAAANHRQTPADVHFQLAETQRLTGDLASARLTIQAALERQPEHLASQQLEKELTLQQERLSAAIPRGQ
jgi:uncharacterized protein HemY